VRQIAGAIELDKAHHQTAFIQNGYRSAEVIYIGTQSWSNDGFGWQGPWQTSWSYGNIVPDKLFAVVSDGCVSSADPKNANLINYAYRPLVQSDRIQYRIAVNVGDRAIVRYEKTDSTPYGINIISTYSYDKTIRITPPKVDMERRLAATLSKFNDIAAETSKDCREALAEVLENWRAYSFSYEIKGGLWSGVAGMHGEYVPPHSVHNVVDGVPYHGGGSETIIVRDQVWTKLPSGTWAKTATFSPLANAVSATWAGSLSIPDFLSGTNYHVGRATCPGVQPHDVDKPEFFELDVYVDSPSGRLFAVRKRMYVDRERLRPVSFETVDPQGRTTQIEARSYSGDIRIDPPPAQ
jgi:hypothetical protein